MDMHLDYDFRLLASWPLRQPARGPLLERLDARLLRDVGLEGAVDERLRSLGIRCIDAVPAHDALLRGRCSVR